MGRTPEMMLAGRAAQFLGIGRDTLRRWNRSGVGPPRTLKGKRYWYAREALREWLKAGAAKAVAVADREESRHSPSRASSQRPPFAPPLSASQVRRLG
jgi:Helix-turn-helix domain